MEHVGYLLVDSSRRLRRAFDDKVRAVGLTGPQARLLLQLDTWPGETQGSYAERLEVEPITLGRMVDRMADAGLVERRADPADRRARRLHLTPRGEHLVPRVRVFVEALNDDMLQGFDADSRRSLVRLLSAISANLERPETVEPHG